MIIWSFISLSRGRLQIREPDPELRVIKEDHDKKNHKYLRREFSYSKFQQAFTLPKDVEKEKISARMNDGVLTINIPKKEPAPVVDTSRMIDIQ